jgi:hypothetical protein
MCVLSSLGFIDHTRVDKEKIAINAQRHPDPLQLLRLRFNFHSNASLLISNDIEIDKRIGLIHKEFAYKYQRAIELLEEGGVD